ncbi:MAG: aquaporin [Patescibacteria group bacterium]
MNDSWHKYIAEFFGVFAIVFIGAGAVLADGTYGGIGIWGIAAAYGLVVLAVTYATIHISGAHLNPAITVALWATGHVKTLVGLGYVLSQLFGAAAAGVLLKVIFATSPEILHLGASGIGTGVTGGIAILMEAIMTFVLVYVYFCTVMHKKELGPAERGGLAMGAVTMAAVLIGFGLTGAAINPARAFGPAVVANFWTLHYIYWVGPLIGSLLAAFVCNFGYMKRT